MKKGDKVTWEDLSVGGWERLSGIVVKEVPAGKSAKQYVPSDAEKIQIRFALDVSHRDRVLVAVPAGKNRQITHYYCPRESAIISYEIKEKEWIDSHFKLKNRS